MTVTGPKETSAVVAERLSSELLLCDGAMGTMLDASGISADRCRPELSLSRADLISAIHQAYVSAGADIIETNTFLANRAWLERFGLEQQVAEINAASVDLARRVITEHHGVDPARKLLVAGAVGPAVPPRQARSISDKAGLAALIEQVTSLDEAGVDLLLFETFGDLKALVELVVATSKVSSLPIVAQVVFLEDARTITGDSPETVVRALEDLNVAAIGVNCTSGPRATRQVVEQLARATSLPLTVQPNAGPPTLVRGRFRYPQGEEYFARAARQFVELGASIVGGCCGTTPRHIEAIACAVRGLTPGPRPTAVPRRSVGSEHFEPAPSAVGSLRSKFARGEFVVACELRLPEGSDPDEAIAEVNLVRSAGADVIVIGSAPSSRVHMSAVTFGLLVRELGVDAVLTVTTFDKSSLALQADLLGAHTFGLQAVICRTGTTPAPGETPSLSGMFEVSSIDLIDMLQALNEARDHSGTRTRRATTFLIGARVNPSAVDIDEELDRARQKLAAGAQFLVTEPVFDIADLRRLISVLGSRRLPILLGVMALRDLEHADYLQYEVGGVRIPEAVLTRLQDAPDAAVGLQLASDLVWEAAPLIHGVVAVPASGTATEAADLVATILGRRPDGLGALPTSNPGVSDHP